MDRTRLALLGRYEEAGLAHPVIGDRSRARLARTAANGAKFPSPWALAAQLRLDVHEDPRCPFDVSADDTGVILRRLPDEAERGLLLFRGLATVLLRCNDVKYRPSDTLALAAELALPARELRANAKTGVVTVQPWVPAWLLSGRLLTKIR